MANQMAKAEVLALIHSGLADFESTSARFSEAQMAEAKVQEEWTVKDILAHITAWERWLLRGLSGTMKAEPVVYSEVEVNRINAEFYEASRARPLADVQADFKRVHQDVLKAVEAQPDVIEGKALELIMNNTHGHYAEHLPAMRAWLDKVPPA
jgi:hypothetical protein